MSYGPDQISRDLTAIGEGSASFETRARLEHHFLMLVQEEGYDALAALLASLPGHTFTRTDDGGTPAATYASTDGIEVRAHRDPHFTILNVAPAAPPSEVMALDPRHQTFYDEWERMIGLADDEVATLEPWRKTVFLVGLLEAEVMNGGLGQYLANTEGRWVEATLACLERIGAADIRSILEDAAALSREAGSGLAAWETRGEELGALDDRFLASRDDLAGLTTDAFARADRPPPPAGTEDGSTPS